LAEYRKAFTELQHGVEICRFVAHFARAAMQAAGIAQGLLRAPPLPR
jgi:hypothetical protein